MRENSILQWLREYAQAGPRELVTGIGDDAAIFRPFENEMVVTTDMVCDGAHFLATECTAAQIGRKAMAVNLSDIAAMACQPVAAFVSLLLPENTPESYAKEVMLAAMELGKEFECVVAGGDTNVWKGSLAVNVLIIGRATLRGPLTRSGARPGDVLMVTGQLGGSIAGHHFSFVPRVRESLALHQEYEIHGGMDISDGLAIDLRRLCVASGCGAEIDAALLPISEAAVAVSSSKEDATRRALGDGEDFELLLAVPPPEAERILNETPIDIPLTVVGKCIAGADLWLKSGEQILPLPDIGYEHGQSDER